MNWLRDLINWFANSPNYMTLTHCMAHDYFWITTTVTLDFLVAAGYLVIAYHWWKNQRTLPTSPAKTALGDMRNIFVFCGICGYIFIPIKMVWPAWRLYDMFTAVLVFFTWRYALNAKHLKVVYGQLGRSQQLADDLERSREELNRKSAFLNALSHDLRTPLNGLMLNANFAELNLKSGNAEVAAGALREIRACTQSTAALLDSLLEYAKVDWSDEGNACTEFDLSSAIPDLLTRFSRQADEQNIFLRAGPMRAGTLVKTDRVKFDRIMTNLLGNALKFTARGGVRVELETARDGFEIHVIDSGIGIEPAQRDRLFDEFFQVNNHARDPRKGVGLGLAIARRLARQLGGDISVESAPGGGSRFTLVLPARCPQAAGGERRAEVEPAVIVSNDADLGATARDGDGRSLANV